MVLTSQNRVSQPTWPGMGPKNHPKRRKSRFLVKNACFACRILIEPILALQKIKITLPANYQVNFRTGSFYGILGFAENTIISAGVNIAPHVADITNGIQAVVVHCDLVNPKYSYHNTGTSGAKSQILYVVSPPSLPPSSLYNVVEPGSSYYVPTNKTQINSIRFWLTDQNGKRINNQGENVNYHVILRKVKSSY